jgi:hypothetical protein
MYRRWASKTDSFLRARRRGELAGTTDIDLAIDRLVGPVYYRILLARQSVPVAFTDALVQRYPAETVDR